MLVLNRCSLNVCWVGEWLNQWIDPLINLTWSTWIPIQLSEWVCSKYGSCLLRLLTSSVRLLPRSSLKLWPESTPLPFSCWWEGGLFLDHWCKESTNLAHLHLFQARNSQAFSNTHPEGPHKYDWPQFIQDGNMLSHLFCVYLVVVLRLFFWPSVGPGCYLRQQTSRAQKPKNT